ncbi:MAG: CoB--CoM heterodisulfide reductase iron-sulfur subunit B family protein [Candidatus Hydrothermarchaeales archaeon]
MKFAYYPGCVIYGSGMEYHMSTVEVTKALDIELVEVSDWNCCGASSSPSLGHELTLALQARNIAIAEKMGLDILAICNECYNNLAQAVKIFSEDVDQRKRINSLIKDIGHAVKGKTNVRHLLDVISKDIGPETLEKKIKKPLSGLKLAPYHGCLALRPREIAIDVPDDPSTMNRILESLGAELVPFDQFTSACCGSSVLLTSENVALKLSYEILKGAKDAGADAIVTMCPLCHLNLDFKQRRIQKRFERELGIPIIYFTQILGLALGIEPKKLGLNKNITSTKKVVKHVETL